MKIYLSDFQGRKIRSDQKNISKGTQIAKWLIPNAQNIPNGIYILNIDYNGKYFSNKIAINCGCN